MKIARLLRTSTLAGFVFVVSAVLAPGAAFAETITPIAPIPALNVLPSVVKGSAPPIASGANAFLANMLYSFQKSPEFWTADAAVKAGTATPTQTKIVTEAGQKYFLPGTKLAPLIKGANAAGAVLLAAQVGVGVGNLQTRLVGIDGQGLVCATQNDLERSILAVLSGNDCTGFFEFPEGFVPNEGITAGSTWGTLCAPGNEVCVTYVGASPYNQNSVYNCLVRTVAAPLPGSPGYNFQTLGSDGISWFTRPLGTNTSSCSTAYPTSTSFYVGAPFNGGRLFPQNGSSAPIVMERVDISSNPDRTTRCELITTTGTVVTASSAPYTEQDARMTAPVCGAVPPGEVLGGTKLWQTTPNAPDELLQDSTTTPEYQHQATQHAECMGGGCRLDLLKTSTSESCLDHPDLCQEWFTDPDKVTSYTCRFGTKTVDLSECTVYAPAFRPDARITGNTVGDPVTGEPLTNPGSGSNPGADAGAFGSPVQDPAAARKCYPTGWAAFNPVEWVMKPVGCALERAFVPKAAKINEATVRINNAWKVTTPAKIIVAIGTVVPALENLSDGSCGGLVVDLSGIAPEILADPSGTLLAACPGDFFAPWAPGFKAFAVISITLFGFFAVKAQLSRFVSNGEA